MQNSLINHTFNDIICVTIAVITFVIGLHTHTLIQNLFIIAK